MPHSEFTYLMTGLLQVRDQIDKGNYRHFRSVEKQIKLLALLSESAQVGYRKSYFGYDQHSSTVLHTPLKIFSNDIDPKLLWFTDNKAGKDNLTTYVLGNVRENCFKNIKEKIVVMDEAQVFWIKNNNTNKIIFNPGFLKPEMKDTGATLNFYYHIQSNINPFLDNGDLTTMPSWLLDYLEPAMNARILG